MLGAIEHLEDCRFDTALLEELAPAFSAKPLSVATPSFQSYATSELAACCADAFPVFSVTGAACALNCEHCRAEILRPMIPAPTPSELECRVRELAAKKRLHGFLLSGGSNRRNEIAYERFLPAIERLKRDLPHLRIAIHSALVDRRRARAFADAGIELAMLDVIGSEETIRDVYHLDRPVADFATSLAALCESGMQVVPHIVIGLHYGRMLGERKALEICASLPIDALVLVVVMPVHARPGTFATPDVHEVAQFLFEARQRLPTVPVNLGCARPYGLYRRTLDAYAVMAGLDSIAFPAEGALALARAIGRPIVRSHACCAVKAAGSAVLEASP